MPVDKTCGPISGVNIVWEVEQRSNPALPGVARRRVEMGFGSCEEEGQTGMPQGSDLLLGPEAGPSGSFPAWGKVGHFEHQF